MGPEIHQYCHDLLRADARLRRMQGEAFRLRDEALLGRLLEMGRRMAELVLLADDLRSGLVSDDIEILRNSEDEVSPIPTVVATSSAPSGEEGAGYPKFFREGDKLVKIGWSKKKGGEYRHICYIENVILMASRIAEMGAGGGPVKYTEIKKDLGTAATNYHIYTAIDWLLEIGLLRREGLEGYVVPPTEDLSGIISARFRDLPEKE